MSQDLIINQQIGKISQSIMMRRSIYGTKYNQFNQYRTHKKSNSNSTIDSGQSSTESKFNKQKSQLCKKYMDHGYCPYEKRCKFAHGLDQLRKNNQYNSKYKTKECGSFKSNHYCVYGDRCNFIHVTGSAQKDNDFAVYDRTVYDFEMELIRKFGQKESKILKLLF